MSFPRFRLAIAASLLTSSAFTFYDDPMDPLYTIFDEVLGGTLADVGWLGQPVARPVRLAEEAPDLYAGEGVALSPAFMEGLSGRALRFRRVTSGSNVGLLVKSRSAPGTRDSLAFSLPAVAIPGDELTLLAEVSLDARLGLPTTLPRQLSAKTGTQILSFTADRRWFPIVLAFRSRPSGPNVISFTVSGDEPVRMRNIRAVATTDICYREFEHGAVFVNPGLHPVTLDIAARFPGRSFARLVGSAGQDPITNDGSPIGPSLTLDPLDALLVRRTA